MTGALAFALRGTTLALRFALPLALIRLLGLEATGQFALVAATAAIAPAALGWGLNNLMTRDLVLQPADAPRLITTRLAVTGASMMVAMVAAIVALRVAGLHPGLPTVPALALVALETLALDIHVILVALGRARQANLLLFLRSALWIPLLLISAWWFEELRSLDAVLYAWIGGHIFASATLASRTRWRRSRIDLAWLKSCVRHCVWIYAADLGLVGQLYADRYLVGAFLGLESLGVYSVCAALAQSLQILASTAVVQPALPRLIAKAGAENARMASLKPVLVRLIQSFGLVLAVFIGSLAVLYEGHAVSVPAGAAATLCLLALAAGGRSFSDAFNAILVGCARHRAYAALSLAGAALATAFSIVLLPMIGMPGAGLAALLAACATLFGRVLITGFLTNRSDG